jgi:hypothetical protein
MKEGRGKREEGRGKVFQLPIVPISIFNSDSDIT